MWSVFINNATWRSALSVEEEESVVVYVGGSDEHEVRVDSLCPLSSVAM
jgi:hypothetical protein